MRVVDGAFDDFGRAEMGEGSVDGVVIAQAWHWCPDHSSAFVSLLFDPPSCSPPIVHPFDPASSVLPLQTS